jgi:hypothetical protein
LDSGSARNKFAFIRNQVVTSSSRFSLIFLDAGIGRIKFFNRFRMRVLLDASNEPFQGLSAWHAISLSIMGDCRSLYRCGLSFRSYFWFGGDAVAVTGWLGDDEEAGIYGAAIEDLMRSLCGDGEAGVWREAMRYIALFGSGELDGEFAREHIEKLRGALVEMAALRGCGRHAFLDDAETGGAMKVPAVTGLRADGAGPGVVLGVGGADDAQWANLPRKRTGYTTQTVFFVIRRCK